MFFAEKIIGVLELLQHDIRRLKVSKSEELWIHLAFWIDNSARIQEEDRSECHREASTNLKPAKEIMQYR